MNLDSSSVAFVAVATTNYVQAARLALNSVHSVRAVRKQLFVVGSKAVRQQGRDVHGIEEINVEDVLPDDVLHRLVSRYTPSEVCFALKPYILAAALSGGEISSAHYIDADLRFFEPVDMLELAFGDGDILLTPHYLSPFPDDGRKPHVLTLLRGGVFNAGYVGVKRSTLTDQFLEWWGNSVLAYGKNEPRNGTSGDQRWLDLVPALFPGCTIWRNPGANVGYWNLHERDLRLGTNGQLEVDGYPLIFFHFSGFDIKFPEKLSKYQDRVDVSHRPVIAKMLAEYAAELRAVEDEFDGFARERYAYRKWWHGESKFVRSVRSRVRKHW
jgi:hypothetical protein